MKLIIGIAIAILLLIVGAWILDVGNDRNRMVKVTELVSAYNDWECGYQNQVGCNVVFEIKSDAVFKVQRIRYGKDFMAVKINNAGLSGWVFSGMGVHVYKEPST